MHSTHRGTHIIPSWANNMAQNKKKMLAAKQVVLSLSLRTHVLEGENQLPTSCPLTSTQVLKYVSAYKYTQTHK